MSQSHKSVTKSSLSITLKRPTQLNTNHATKPKSPNISESTHISKRPNSLHLWDGCIKYSLLHITPYPPPTHKRNHDDKRPYFFLHSFILKILLHQGRTDISSVLVGNVLDAPHRRDRFLIGFMLVPILFNNNQQTLHDFDCLMIKVGPHNTYPEHAHAADEGYHILAGKIFLIISYLEWRWQRNGVANMMRMLVILETMIKNSEITGPYHSFNRRGMDEQK